MTAKSSLASSGMDQASSWAASMSSKVIPILSRGLHRSNPIRHLRQNQAPSLRIAPLLIAGWKKTRWMLRSVSAKSLNVASWMPQASYQILSQSSLCITEDTVFIWVTIKHRDLLKRRRGWHLNQSTWLCVYSNSSSRLLILLLIREDKEVTI